MDIQNGVKSEPVPGEYREFSVLGSRFAYQPDEMRLLELPHHAPLPAPRPVRVPQFELPAIKPRMLVLLPTLRCNLRCTYCFAGHGNTADMSRDTMHAALALLPANTQASIGFFGGEPLLNWDLLADAVALARSRFSYPSFALTTNATLLAAEHVEFLARHNFSLIVSLDGPARLHNRARPFAGGADSYDRVIAALELISAAPRLAARTTLRATFDGSGSCAFLLERVRHLNELLHRYGLGNVSVEPADLTEGCARAAQPVRPSEALYNEYIDTAQWYVRQTRLRRAPRFHHFDVRLRRLRSRTPAPAECGGGVGYLAVAPDGALHACHRLGCPVGDVHTGIDMRQQQPWRDNRYYARTGCADCWLRNVCGGGCRVNSLTHCGNIASPEPLGCWLTETCVRCAAYIMAKSAE